MRTTPAGLAEERFGGVHCCCNILLPAWSRNSGVWMSWDSRLVGELVTNTPDLPLKTPSNNPTDTHSDSLNSSAAFIFESNRGAHFRRDREVAKQWTQRARFIAECSRDGTDVLQRLLLLHGPGRGATKGRQGQQKSKRRRSTKEGKAGRVCREAVP